MRDYGSEITGRVAFIRKTLGDAGASGIVFANSGGKDCALTGILCKKACDDTVGLILPCGTARNYGADDRDARELADAFGIETRVIDLGGVAALLMEQIGKSASLKGGGVTNIAPRLRMLTAYAVGNSENRLVAGTGNRSERYMGYFTKWGDGACDFNPIADLTVSEVYEFLRFLEAPGCVIDKAPSAGLYEGQTDEADMGVTYEKIDDYILRGNASDGDLAVIERFHKTSGHKRRLPPVYTENDD